MSYYVISDQGIETRRASEKDAYKDVELLKEICLRRAWVSQKVPTSYDTVNTGA